MIQLKPGLRLMSVVCDTELIVVRGDGATDVRCGGAPMVVAGTDGVRRLPLNPAYADGTVIGKRYADPEAGVEVLCTRAGEGSLSVGSAAIALRDAKPLPASD